MNSYLKFRAFFDSTPREKPFVKTHYPPPLICKWGYFLLLLIFPVVFQAQIILFNNGYEESVQIVEDDLNRDNVIGIDNTYSPPNDWDCQLPNYEVNIGEYYIMYEMVEGTDPDAMKASIVQETSGNKVMLFEITDFNEDEEKGRVQANIYHEEEYRYHGDMYVDGLKEFHYTTRMLLHDDFSCILNDTNTEYDFFTIAEFFNYRDPSETMPGMRITVKLIKVAGDNTYTLVIKGDRRLEVNGEIKWIENWRKSTASGIIGLSGSGALFQLGEWLTLDVSFKEGKHVIGGTDDQGGRLVVNLSNSTNTETLEAYNVNTQDPNDDDDDGVHFLNVQKLYMGKEEIERLRSEPCEVSAKIYWDDFVLDSYISEYSYCATLDGATFDAEEDDSGNMFIIIDENDPDPEFNRLNIGENLVGLQFSCGIPDFDPPNNIPPQVTSAYLRFVASNPGYNQGDNTISVNIFGELTDNQNQLPPTPYSNTAFNISNRLQDPNLVTDPITWTIDGTWDNNNEIIEVDIAPIINSILCNDQGHFESTDVFSIIITQAINGTSGQRQASSYDGDVDEAPQLCISYGPPAISATDASFSATQNDCTSTEVTLTGNSSISELTHTWTINGIVQSDNVAVLITDQLQYGFNTVQYEIEYTANGNCAYATQETEVTVLPCADFIANQTGCTQSVVISNVFHIPGLIHTWESDIDGVLNTSLADPTLTLSYGVHTITHTMSINGVTETTQQMVTVNFCPSDADFTGGQTDCTSSIEFNCLEDNPEWTHSWTVNGMNYAGNECSITGDINSAPFNEGGPNTIIHTITAPGGLQLSSSQTVELYDIDHQGDYTVTSGPPETWQAGGPNGDPVVVIAGNLIIEPGASLTVDSDVTVMFCGKDSRLIIEAGDGNFPGGNLILEGTLTDFQGQTWQGVQVLGQSFAPQTETHQGRFDGMEGAEIHNARIAINAGPKSWPLSQSGGIIYCTKMKFRNNTQGVVINRYTNTLNYKARIYGCEFTVDDNYHMESSFFNFIRLWDVYWVRILGCQFTNSMTLSDADDELDYGVGIWTTDASFRVDDYCDGIATSNGCVGELLPSQFNRLGYGIAAWRAHNTTKPAKPFIVRSSEFDGCFVGIRNNSISGSTILFNTFRLGTLPVDDITDQCGIVFEGEINGFTCQENSFGNLTGETDYETVGIECNSLMESDENIIRSNGFYGLTTGNLAMGTNGNNDPIEPQGLTYLCNTNHNVQGFDIDVAEDGLIRLTQGILDENMAAGNTFSDPANVMTPSGIYNDNENPLIRYWFFDNEPSIAPPGSVENVSENIIENTCPEEFCEPPCQDDDELDALKSDYYATKAAYQVLKADYDSNPTEQKARTLAQYRREMNHASYMVVLHELYDTIGFEKDTLYTWIRNMENVGAELWLSNMYLADGDAATALNILDAIPTQYTLSSEQTQDLQRYRTVTNLLAGEDLDNLKTETLETLATYDDSGGQTEFFAKRILTYYGVHYPPEYVFSQPGAGENSDPGDGNVEPSKAYVTASPNPAKDFVIFRVQLPDEVEGTLEVRDINGRLLFSKSVLEGIQSFEWNTEALPSGIYFYTLRTMTNDLQYGKLVLNK